MDHYDCIEEETYSVSDAKRSSGARVKPLQELIIKRVLNCSREISSESLELSPESAYIKIFPV